jgi:hypothetical protein
MARDGNPRSLHFVDFCFSSRKIQTQLELSKHCPKMQSNGEQTLQRDSLKAQFAIEMFFHNETRIRGLV